MKVKDFLHGYMTCALWSSSDDEGEPLDANYHIDDIALQAAAAMRQDCIDFILANEDDLDEYEEQMRHPDYTASERAGHDFWLTRNGHGAGFWDRGLGALGDRLADAAKACGSVDLYVGDDGLIHQS